jgi:transposase
MSYTPVGRPGGETVRPAGNPKTLERRRHRAIALLAEGWSPVEVARHVGVDRRSVRRWRAAHDREGPEGVASRRAPGRPSKLDARSRQRLEQLLLKGARASGFPTDLWTCPRIGEVIHRTFDIEYHVDHLGRLLRSLGWTPQKPERQARERNEAAIRRWVKVDWPRIKKNRNG